MSTSKVKSYFTMPPYTNFMTVDVTWIWSHCDVNVKTLWPFLCCLWRQAATTLWNHHVTSMWKFWHLWLFCIWSSEQILAESDPFSSGRLFSTCFWQFWQFSLGRVTRHYPNQIRNVQIAFIYQQACDTWDDSSSGLVTRFFPKPTRKFLLGIYFF